MGNLPQVNGTRKNLPVYIGGNKIAVQLSGSYVVLKTNFGLSVRFDGNQYVEVAMPPEYQGMLCGLCGETWELIWAREGSS